MAIVSASSNLVAVIEIKNRAMFSP